MRGTIHGIWLTQRGGKLHPEIIPSLSSWVSAAASCDFSIVLWTNIKELAPEELKRLKAAKIIAIDHSACKASPLYKYFLNFLEIGIKGDKTAFALASDVLRMAILDLTENDKYFIYVDPNDIALFNLKDKLENLDLHMSHNKFGFSFNVEPTPYRSDMFDVRNDVLIALKNKNISFFKDYLNAYWEHLEKTYESYVKPSTDYQAQQQALSISNQISDNFFRVDSFNDHSIRVVTQFANYNELYQRVNSAMYLNSERKMMHGNTWLPIGDLKEEWKELAKYGISPENIDHIKKSANISSPVMFNEIATTNIDKIDHQDQSYLNPKLTSSVAIFGLLSMIAIVWMLAKGRLIKQQL
jgi:hypothetical protein